MRSGNGDEATELSGSAVAAKGNETTYFFLRLVSGFCISFGLVWFGLSRESRGERVGRFSGGENEEKRYREREKLKLKQ